MGEETELTDREKAVAKAAAKLAVAEMAAEFYRQVGKTVVNRILVVLGVAFVAFAYGKGWIGHG
jgi:hypothetical protein